MIDIDRDKVLQILIWCENKFGKPKHRKNYPKLIVYNRKGIVDNIEVCGYFKNNTIVVFLKEHKSVKELCKTIIHEYKHFTLKNDEYLELSEALKKKGYDENDLITVHPHEKRAISFEDKYGDICFKELKNRLYSK
jgi:hypothetical protein